MSIQVWGHRGHRHHRYNGQHGITHAFHENSMQAYLHALKKTMGLECDVVQSQQNTPFLIHDTLFNGIAKYALDSQLDDASRDLLHGRYIFQIADDELRLLRLKDGQPLVRLLELLRVMGDFPDRTLNLELKGPSVSKSTLHSVELAIRQKWIKPEQIILSSYNLPKLQNLRQNSGTRFKISAMLTPTDLVMAQMYPNWPNAEQNAYYVPFSKAALQRSDIQEIQPDYLHIEAGDLSKEHLEWVEEIHPNAKLILWSAGEKHPDEAPHYADLIHAFAPTNMIYAVMSDFPEILQKKLQEKGTAIALPPDPFANIA